MGRRTGRMDWSNGQTEGLIGWTDELDGQTEKQTHRWKVGRTDKRTGWTRWKDGREGLDGLDWTDGQDGRTGWTDEGADRRDGRTDRLTG